MFKSHIRPGHQFRPPNEPNDEASEVRGANQERKTLPVAGDSLQPANLRRLQMNLRVYVSARYRTAGAKKNSKR
jgi:hypothetical protein